MITVVVIVRITWARAPIRKCRICINARTRWCCNMMWVLLVRPLVILLLIVIAIDITTLPVMIAIIIVITLILLLVRLLLRLKMLLTSEIACIIYTDYIRVVDILITLVMSMIVMLLVWHVVVTIAANTIVLILILTVIIVTVIVIVGRSRPNWTYIVEIGCTNH